MPTKTTLICLYCSSPFECSPWQIKATGRKYCSRACSARASKGASKVRRNRGFAVSANGYKLVFVNGRQKYEHRQVMEHFLGRELEPHEEVHHASGDKLDNRISNLRIVSRAQHMKIHAVTNGWSRKHPACVECGTTERRHNCWGFCSRCYNAEYRRRKQQKT